MEPERCQECGFDGTRLRTKDAVAALRSLGRRWRVLFEDVPDERLRARPEPQTWSALEYAAHTRDVIALIGWGMHQVLEGGSPSFPGMDPEPADNDRGYNALEPSKVLDELEANANRMADRAERALPEHMKRTGTLGGDEADAGWLLRHAIHDATHHLRDVERGLASRSGGA